jgi:hypothetical protein
MEDESVYLTKIYGRTHIIPINPTNPTNPIHLVIGTFGTVFDEKNFKPQPA